MQPSLHGERIVLLPLRAEHEDAVVRVFGDPALSEFMPIDLSDPAEGRAMVRRRLAYAGPPELGHWVITLGQLVIGLAHLRPSGELPAEQAEIGWYLDTAYNGRGYATEAGRTLLAYGLGSLRLPAVRALVHEDNTASRAVALRCGFLDVGGGHHYGGPHRVHVALPPAPRAAFAVGAR